MCFIMIYIATFEDYFKKYWLYNEKEQTYYN